MALELAPHAHHGQHDLARIDRDGDAGRACRLPGHLDSVVRGNAAQWRLGIPLGRLADAEPTRRPSQLFLAERRARATSRARIAPSTAGRRPSDRFGGRSPTFTPVLGAAGRHRSNGIAHLRAEQVAAVDDDLRPVDVRGQVRREEHDRRGRSRRGRPSGASGTRPAAVRPLPLRRRSPPARPPGCTRSRPPSATGPGATAFVRMPLRPELQRQALRQPPQRVLRRRAVRHPLRGRVPARRSTPTFTISAAARPARASAAPPAARTRTRRSRSRRARPAKRVERHLVDAHVASTRPRR